MFFKGKKPSNIGVNSGELSQCPDKPNCVCSQETRHSHRVEPISSSTLTMADVKAAVSALQGATIITSDSTYLHAECKTKLLGFVDDLEVLWDTEHNLFHIRSASRLGYADFGANRKRVETLKNLLTNS